MVCVPPYRTSAFAGERDGGAGRHEEVQLFLLEPGGLVSDLTRVQRESPTRRPLRPHSRGRQQIQNSRELGEGLRVGGDSARGGVGWAGAG